MDGDVCWIDGMLGISLGGRCVRTWRQFDGFTLGRSIDGLLLYFPIVVIRIVPPVLCLREIFIYIYIYTYIHEMLPFE